MFWVHSSPLLLGESPELSPVITGHQERALWQWLFGGGGGRMRGGSKVIAASPGSLELYLRS